MRAALNNYIDSGHKQVQGWLQDIAIDLAYTASVAQKQRGIRGPVCEIGVHHGRFFILLHLLTEAGERSVAWDLFERQSENVDRSGKGDEQMFRSNLVAQGCVLEEIGIHTANSLDLTPESIIETCRGRPRLFSVDGGHTADLTAHDLHIAQGALCPGGIVILDDFFNESWPGVAEGTTRYLAQAKNGPVPFVIGGNKVMLTTNAEYAAAYRKSIADQLEYRPQKKTADFFGHEVLIVPTPPPTLRRLLSSKFKRKTANQR